MAGRRLHIRDNLHGLAKPQVMRLAHRAGIRRMSGLVYNEVLGITRDHMERILRGALVHMLNRNGKTILLRDIKSSISEIDDRNITSNKGVSKKVKSCSGKRRSVKGKK